MWIMRVVGLLILIVVIGCSPAKEEKEVVDAMPAISGLLNVDDFDLIKNPEGQWASDSITHMGMVAMNKQINNVARKLEDMTIQDYNSLGVSLKAAIGNVATNQNLGDDAQLEFSKLLAPMQSEISKLEGTELKTAQIAMYNIGTITDTYLKHFSAK
jgi:hypothetical protein